MKKTMSVLLVLLIILSLSACGASKYNGTYESENGTYRLILKDGKVKWYEYSYVFKGIYTVENKIITFEIEGSGFFADSVFVGRIEGKNFILDISNDDFLFIKQ